MQAEVWAHGGPLAFASHKTWGQSVPATHKGILGAGGPRGEVWIYVHGNTASLLTELTERRRCLRWPMLQRVLP